MAESCHFRSGGAPQWGAESASQIVGPDGTYHIDRLARDIILIGPMDYLGHGRTVTPYRPTPTIAERRIKRLAMDSDHIAWSKHAEERMAERGIYDIDVLRTLPARRIDHGATGRDTEGRVEMQDGLPDQRSEGGWRRHNHTEV